jgi:hypothetical protein
MSDVGVTGAGYQTVRLDKGAHTSPERGMCAVELASQLAGERFSDHPRSVCPVIAAFVRAYNDRVGPERRQDLVPYAARIVGTRGDRALEHARAVRCAVWSTARDARTVPGLARGRGARFRVTREHAACCAAVAIRADSDAGHREALALLDELIALGRPEGAVPDMPPAEFSAERDSRPEVSAARAGG